MRYVLGMNENAKDCLKLTMWSVVSFVLLSWFWHIGVAVVMSVSGSFVLEVLLVIVDKDVLVSCWLGFSNLASVLSQEIVDNLVLLESVNVHISHWWQHLLGDFSAGGSSPVSLNSLHVPLVDDGDNVLLLDVVNFSENCFASPID